MKNTIIYLVGNPGVGKQTVAEKIAAKENVTIVNSHAYTDAIFNLSDDFANPKHKEYRLKMRDVVYDAMVDLCPQEQSFIFTNVVYKNNASLKDSPLEAAANRRGALFVPIHLVCEKDENKKRIRNPFRKKYHKSTNPDVIDNIETPEIEHKNLKVIDTTKMPADMVADAILAHVKGLQNNRVYRTNNINRR